MLTGKLEGKRPRGRSRHRYEYNIKKDRQEVRCGLLTGSTCLRIIKGGGTSECSNESLSSIKCGEFLTSL
jgi:hypothetical protein